MTNIKISVLLPTNKGKANGKMTPAEKKFRNLMVIYFLLFAGGALWFYFRPENTVRAIITVGTWLGFAKFETSPDKFWVILSVAMMVAIAACCFIASLKVRATRHYVIPVLASKLTSSGLGVYEFTINVPHPFHYLVIAVVDFPLFLIAFVFYLRALGSAGRDVKPVPEKAEPAEKSAA